MREIPYPSDKIPERDVRDKNKINRLNAKIIAEQRSRSSKQERVEDVERDQEEIEEYKSNAKKEENSQEQLVRRPTVNEIAEFRIAQFKKKMEEQDKKKIDELRKKIARL